MNPDRIYSQYRDDALAEQITAEKYTTFAAMPFADRFSYRSTQIFESVICGAVDEANRLNETQRKFARPKRADQVPGVAVVITEEIVVDILRSHFFIADWTQANPGVILETGIALGLKANSQLILIMQGSLTDLHFDIRTNRVINYDPDEKVHDIEVAFVEAAKAFEADADRRILSISQKLTREAITCLNVCGRLWRDNPDKRPSLFFKVFSKHSEDEEPDARVRFELAVRQLLDSGLVWHDYKPRGGGPGIDTFGYHATELGWAVITNMWDGLKKPDAAPTRAGAVR